jgi:histidinol-phosphate aminotransferase
MFNLNKLIRENIKNLVPYSSARDEFTGEASIFLDANENSLGSPIFIPSPTGEEAGVRLNRYPDPYQLKLKEEISKIKGIPPQHIFLGNGSDECIDVLLRSFCEPKKDNVIVCPPTYGMYEVSANINEVEVRKAPLTEDFQLDLIHLENLIDGNTKIVWICSPNNPTGNSLNREDILMVLNNFNGLVVIDEAYINFSRQKGFLQELTEYANLVVLQTFSKAWGLAGLSLGITFASSEIIKVMNKVKPPYNINQATQEIALSALKGIGEVNNMIVEIVKMRDALINVLSNFPTVEKVNPSDSNFIFVKIKDARKAYEFLLTKGIVVRDRSNVQFCENGLRITVGTEDENTELIDALGEFINLKMR